MIIVCSVQEFWRMCDETKAWINEKDVSFSSEDCGKDLASVQLLQRKQQVRMQLWSSHGQYILSHTNYKQIMTAIKE